MVSEDLMLMPNLVPQCEALKLYRGDLEQHIKGKKSIKPIAHCCC